MLLFGCGRMRCSVTVTVTLILIAFWMFVAVDGLEGGAADEDIIRNPDAILSRRKRYLTFPSGSSFQLVYDLIIGVIDYTNYLIIGVTSALAWQLPSDPPSEIIDNLRDRLNDGTFGTSRNDTIENIEYVDTKPKQTQTISQTPRTPQNPQRPNYITSFTNPNYAKPQTLYYTSNQFHPPMDKNYYSSKPVYYSKPSSTFLKKNDANYYSTRPNPLTEWKDSKIRKVSPSSWSTATKQTYPQTRKQVPFRRQRIYPVFAKRSVDAHNRQKRHGIPGPKLSTIDNIHLRYHRSTRQDLYTKIEKYLETHNKHGHHCVLKALCETGQKHNESEPGTFVGEIMRSIFTMPESEDPVHNYMHKVYDEAHAHDGDCTGRYHLCEDSLWKADFIF